MRAYKQENGREEADGLTECCAHGIPAMCQCKKCDESERESRLSPARGSAATSELSEIINAARERGCAEHGHEIKWLLELPMTDEEWKRFNELTGWPSRKQQNVKGQR